MIDEAPPPLTTGLFYINQSRYVDENAWNNLNPPHIPGRRNCYSSRLLTRPYIARSDWSSRLLATVSHACKTEDIFLSQVALSAFLISVDISDKAQKMVMEKGLHLMRDSARKTKKHSSARRKMHMANEAAREQGETRMVALIDFNLHLISVFVDVLDHPSTEFKGSLINKTK
ncbi:unnamed protein product [Arabis nemorensis]|uniref:Uncharacterized protein n=1 Tax=Arabis nemorensis TaxID=586526 RepID=A0A565CAI4_9BRAS|nr:unnamed protein product [Arabis nemorensis]